MRTRMLNLLPMMKYCLRYIYVLGVVGIISFLFSCNSKQMTQGENTAVRSCFLSICQNFEEYGLMGRNVRGITTTWTTINEPKRTEILSDLFSTGVDCGKMKPPKFEDSWDSPISISMKLRINPPEEIFLELRSAGVDKIINNDDDIVEEAKWRATKE